MSCKLVWWLVSLTVSPGDWLTDSGCATTFLKICISCPANEIPVKWGALKRSHLFLPLSNTFFEIYRDELKFVLCGPVRDSRFPTTFITTYINLSPLYTLSVKRFAHHVDLSKTLCVLNIMGSCTTILLHRKNKMWLRSELPIDLHKNTFSLFGH